MVSLHPCEGGIGSRLAIVVLSRETRSKSEEAASVSCISDSEDIGELIDIETARPTQRALIEFRRGDGRCLIRIQITDANVQYLCRRNSPVIVEPVRVGIVQRRRGDGPDLGKTIEAGPTLPVVIEIETYSVLRIDIVIDFETWDGRVIKSRVSRDDVIVDQVAIRWQRDQVQNLLCYGIDGEQVQINFIVRKGIPNRGTVRRNCRCRWIVDGVLKDVMAKRINSRLAKERRQLPRFAEWTPRSRSLRNCCTEVTTSVCKRRHCCQSVCDAAGLAVLIEVKEEESFVVAVVPFSKRDRPADVEAPVI